MGWQVPNTHTLAARPLAAVQVLCAVSASLPLHLGSSSCCPASCHPDPGASSHPLGVDGCNCTAFIKGDATPWPPRLPPGFPCATRLKPHSATVHQSVSVKYHTPTLMTAYIFNPTSLSSRTRASFLHFATKCQKEPPKHLQTCSVQGPTFAVQL